MFGKRRIKTHSQTQETVALSSGESDSYGIAKAVTLCLGMMGLMADPGLEVEVQVNTDSSAEKSTASRRGAGRVGHVAAQDLWV